MAISLLGLSGLLACGREKPLFERLDSAGTGVTFANTLTESDSLNVLKFEYIYNGSGVGVGDFNRDGLPDLFFSGSQVPGKLYLNQGNLTFQNVTPVSGIRTPYWSTGVSVVDINADGWPDIYLCTISPDRAKSVPNQLFLNQGLGKAGIPTFREVAAQVGLADSSYSTQATFLDYDRDGDLDMYLLTNALESFDRSIPMGQRTDGSGKSTDKLFRNDGLSAPNGLPHFTDVSRLAGITTEGWGLGVCVTDINQDGWPDIYCANDFQSNDHLWVNNGAKRNAGTTFTNRIATSIPHQSMNSMGVDIADFNNDGLADIVTLDMMPADNLRQKMMFSKPNYERYQLNRERGYQPQFVRNMLQLNLGTDNQGNPVFGDIGQLAGVSATDWSWSALWADFDNDGQRDLLVTNGYVKDITNMDFVSYGAREAYSSSNEALVSPLERLAQLQGLLGVKKSNYLFRNKGDLTFEDVTDKWGLSIPSYSNGAAYADLDNDGDLDIVVNNLNDEAFIYRNRLNEREARVAATYLRVRLVGTNGNRAALGATVDVFQSGRRQVAYQTLQRGYESSVDPTLHFGLGTAMMVDSVRVTWPDGSRQMIRNVRANQVLTVSEQQPHLSPMAYQPTKPKSVGKTFFQDVSNLYGLAYKHTERDYVDFKVQPLLEHKHSQAGPGLTVGDVNGDGLEDAFIGGSAGQAGQFFIQQRNDQFRQKPFVSKPEEDTGVLLFDADNDGDNDLYCVSGSSEFGRRTEFMQDRLYLNDGRGQFRLNSKALPVITASGSVVVAQDFDRDGDLDLFVGGRVSPADYPVPPRSYLLQNDGHGHFTDVTAQRAPGLDRIGMVTSAVWSDYDRDGWSDLMLVGEFMPITLFQNQHGTLSHLTVPSFAETVGWWNSLVAADFDHDGDTDYIAGNLGLNSVFKASPQEPVCLYAKDYNNDGLMDPVLCRFIAGREVPAHFREALTDQMIGLRKVLTHYRAFGQMSFRDLFDQKATENALIYKATCFATTYIENLGNKPGTGPHFRCRAMPMSMQTAPVSGLIATDLNHDGYLDLLAVGNDFSPETLTGRYDASVGWCLWGDGRGHFTTISLSQTGFLVKGDAKAIGLVKRANGQPLIWITQNQDSLQVFQPSN